VERAEVVVEGREAAMTPEARVATPEERVEEEATMARRRTPCPPQHA
jgi:hypothetical protein